MIFSFVQIPESAQAETEQGELTAQSQYQASNITKPLNIKYKDRQGVLYTLNDVDLTAKVASDNQSCDFSSVDGVYEIPAKVTFKGKEYVVREVEERAFYRVSTLKEIIIPDTVVTIGALSCSGKWCPERKLIRFTGRKKEKENIQKLEALQLRNSCFETGK